MSCIYEFDNAIAAHKVWLRHLEFYLDGIESDHFNVEAMGDSTACGLGQWLGSVEQKCREMPNFRKLVETHHLFHGAAAEILDLIHAQRLGEAQDILKGRVSELSVEVVALLETMKDGLFDCH